MTYGLFVLVVNGIIFSINNIKNKKFNEKQKEEARKKNQDFYIDYQGNSRNIINDRSQFWIVNENNEQVLMDVNTGNVVRNLAQEKREKEIRESYETAIKNGNSVYCINPDNGIKYGYREKIVGKRYKDLKEPKIYVQRTLNGKTYYMNIDTFVVERLTDYELKVGKKEDKEELERINNLLNITPYESAKYRNHSYDVFCDLYL